MPSGGKDRQPYRRSPAHMEQRKTVQGDVVFGEAKQLASDHAA